MICADGFEFVNGSCQIKELVRDVPPSDVLDHYLSIVGNGNVFLGLMFVVLTIYIIYLLTKK